MRNRLGRRGLGLLVATTALIAIAAGVSYAAIPSSSTGTINGCYEKKTGLLRVIDTQAGKNCGSWEIPISWSQQGPKGVAGAQGPAGPAGATGSQGLKGDPGAQGVKGDRGDPGAMGVAGPAGPKGDDGADGATGLATLDALEGTACVRTDGSAGTVHVVQGNTIAITCAGAVGQCPDPLPSYPHATVGCEGGTIFLASCEPGWADVDGQLENGCETVHLGGPEICGNGIDDDGDGLIDEVGCAPALSLSVGSGVIHVGDTVTLSVELAMPAAVDTFVILTWSGPIGDMSSMVVPAGQTSGQVDALAIGVGQVVVTATLGSVSVSVTFPVEPPS